MKLYWVSAIIHNADDKYPWLCAKSDGSLSLDEAKKEIEFLKQHNHVLSAWVDVFEDDAKTTVFHECYMQKGE